MSLIGLHMRRGVDGGWDKKTCPTCNKKDPSRGIGPLDARMGVRCARGSRD